MKFENAARLIREIPDYPKPGILFRDITPLLADGEAFEATIAFMDDVAPDCDYVAGAEARGFIFGSALALHRTVGFIPLRKPGKLPGQTLAIEYGLEYGKDALHIHTDSFAPGSKVLFIDDVLATGGTAAAGIELLRRSGAVVVAALFLLEISGLDGRATLHQSFPELSVISLVNG